MRHVLSTVILSMCPNQMESIRLLGQILVFDNVAQFACACLVALQICMQS